MNAEERKRLEQDILRRRDEWINSDDEAPAAPVDVLREKNAEIARLQAELAQAKALLQRVYHVDPLKDEWFQLADDIHNSGFITQQPTTPVAPVAPASDVTLSAKYKVNDLVTLVDSDWPRRILKVYVSPEQGKIEYMVEGIINRWYQEGELTEFKIFDDKMKPA